MGLWHGVEYYEKEKIVGEEYYQMWSNVSNVFRCDLAYYARVEFAQIFAEQEI